MSQDAVITRNILIEITDAKIYSKYATFYKKQVAFAIYTILIHDAISLPDAMSHDYIIRINNQIKIACQFMIHNLNITLLKGLQTNWTVQRR